MNYLFLELKIELSEEEYDEYSDRIVETMKKSIPEIDKCVLLPFGISFGGLIKTDRRGNGGECVSDTNPE